MSWFSDLVGFDESHAAVQANLTVSGSSMTSAANGRTFGIGTLTTPSLQELRAAVGPVAGGGRLQVRQVVADVTQLHQQGENAGALFQVASQFNLLEMVGPHRTPEDGVTGYAHDRTQGPACAMAAGPATIYRNYFAPVGSQRGQSAARQLDMLADLGDRLGTHKQPPWTMRNGYALCSADELAAIRSHLAALDEGGIDALRGALRIGVHRGVEVTKGGSGSLVTQAFCSALPVAYSPHGDHAWAPFAQLILEASYEATLLAALHSARSGGSPRVFLTLLGGGAFGNRSSWILSAIRRALRLASKTELDVRIVSYRRADPMVDDLARAITES